MELSAATVTQIADVVDAAQRHGREMTKLTDTFPDLDVEGAYAVQGEICRRWEAEGRHISGYKAGLTSTAKMLQMGVTAPVFGVLMADTCVPETGSIEHSSFIHPKVEAEIALVTSRELSGADVSIQEVIDSTEFVLPAIEIIDSRYENFRFDAASVIADNTSAARYVVGGSPRRPQGLDLRLLGVVMERNGELIGTAAGAAVLGHPAASVSALVAWLAASGRSLRAGSLVMTGGVTEAVAVNRGDAITTRVGHLGTVGVRFV